MPLLEKGSLQQKEAFAYIQSLAHLRRESCALNMGTLLHYIPQNEVYVYFRTFEDEHKMIVLNRNSEEVSLDLSRFQQGLEDFSAAIEVWTGETTSLEETLTIAPMGALIFDLK